MFKKIKELLNLNKTIQEKESYLKEIVEKTNNREKIISETIAEAKASIQSEAEEIIVTAKKEADELKVTTRSNLSDLISKKDKIEEEANEAEENLEKVNKELTKLKKAATKFKSESVGIKELIEKFPSAVDYTVIEQELELLEKSLGDGVLNTIIELDLHHKDSKTLRKDMNANIREIKKVLTSYESRYTTKANKTIYHLMVIGLQAELQNILYTLSYTNLDKALENAKSLTDKYLTICGNGNASILPTITRFLSELEPLFNNAIEIEYSYYVQKEKEKEEQRRIKEQMRQEAEEQRILEQERKKIEKEEEKYLKEISNNKELISKETDLDKIAKLEARLKELVEQVEKIEEQKEEILKRANGKAGYVYVISNLGSFGDNMFKIGMTRRLNPLDRIDELGDASVPFKFDIHAMVFSDDAVGLEQKMHQTLKVNRVNKINLRKEFFYSDIVNLENIIQSIDPTVEFTTTMKALEFRQSQSIKEEKLQVL
ncbi:GIY-YIG nuclease family protein [Peribacillus sp. NJ11]|uniref:GIY-YIG nuclease family protein n=1 Tax=Peribacillus sp. NJ11 TaxID=3055861 RepID=UPI0025A23F2B|nr:GIY-YIG nuclease family protein [Peribacillus sp. NJ11]MDM5222992.1 GIY-YIG nuclease family protein [Peribacillus sp. NJ11]